ncbi:serine hydrolase domain-containing protein [Tahibacter harae]|uniref:Beta-lactamase family protein n=1 Tax=Tahibacter harae TaxID=2963937 RepID=A0ABT1QXM1_9GAMM|nr:serine hydrolase domain-containing protein [Tahibacter harae]MCQ4167039.1 beta-lactamase family protein [Tahibacter harae]
MAALAGLGGTALAEDAGLPPALQAQLQRGVEHGVWPLVAAGYADGAASSLALPGNSDTTAGAGARFALGDAGAIYNGLLLARLASHGRLRLDDRIADYLPAGFACADARVCAITLQQLATNDSGLPPLPANLFPRHPGQLWRDYRETDLLEFLANYQLPPQPAARESALGQLLLGWILGRVHGGGYAAALAQEVTGPLGLVETSGSAQGLVPGSYDGRQSLPPPAAEFALPLNLNTSAGDLLRLVQAMLRPGDSPLRPALLLSRQPQDRRGNAGLGWRISLVRDGEQEWPLVWQQSNRGGYSVFLGFRTDQQRALVLLGNSDANLTPQGLAQLMGGSLPTLPPREAAAPADPAQYAGLYEFSPGSQLLIRVTPAGLSAQASGRLAARLRPLGPDQFDLPGEAIQLNFQRDALGRIDALRWVENGLIVPVQRLSTRAPQLPRTPVTLSAGQLAAFCGDYRVDGDVLVRFHCGEKPGLQFSGGIWRELNAYGGDHFGSADGDFELAARRGADGTVSGLQLVLLGDEAELPRVHWPALAPEVVQSLQREQQHRAAEIAAARQAAPPDTAPAQAAAPAPWQPAVAALQPAEPAPPAPVVLGPLGSVGHTAPAAAIRPAAPGRNESAPAAQTVSTVRAVSAPAAVPASAASASALPATTTTGRAAAPAQVRPVTAPPPAAIEALPEREQRPRFVPPPPLKDNKHDAT